MASVGWGRNSNTAHADEFTCFADEGGEARPAAGPPGELAFAVSDTAIQKRWTNIPSASLGSNQVDLGGMIWSLSATRKSSESEVGCIEKATP